MSSVFISIEGIEGCGKSTQVARLESFLKSKGHAVEVTREPGGTPIAEAIRRLVLDPSFDAMTPVTEFLLVEAARAQHVAERIRPALDAGKIVVCDRFYDSTTAYQGAGRGLPGNVLNTVHLLSTGGLCPNLTVVIDIPTSEGLKRAVAARSSDRMEREPSVFHDRIREAFLELAKQEPARIRVVDGMQSIDEVAKDIQGLVGALLGEQ